MQGFRRRVAEGSPKGRRKRILADINARPPDARAPGNCRDGIATHSGRGGAGEREKRKSPPRKKPPTKKEKPLLAAPLAYGRLRRPPLSLLFSLPSAAAPPLSPPRFSLLLWAAAPPLLFASPLALLSGGCAALPLPLLFASSAAAPPLSYALSWAAGAAPLALLSYTMKSRLSETHMGIGVPLSPDCENQRFSCQGLLRLSLSEACFVTVTCHKLFFFYLLP